MAQQTIPPVSEAAIDQALERLFGLLPAHMRAVDAANGRQLEALFRLFAEGDAEIDRMIGALYDNQFIETANADTLDHFAALTGTPQLAPLPQGGHNFRSFIANSVRYNRGKGTARVLEQLAADVTGFAAVAVEYFQRLAKLQHGLDFDLPRPGTAAVRPGETAALAGRAFDALPRITDVRSVDRAGGRYHFDNVGLHVDRFAVQTWPQAVGAIVPAEDLSAVPEARPWLPGGTPRPGYFQLAAQPDELLCLFNPDGRDMGRFERPDQTDMADRLRRLPLHLETSARREAAIEGRPYMSDGEPWFSEDSAPFVIYLRRQGESGFSAVPPEQVKIANLAQAPTPAGFRPDATISHSWFEAGSAAAVPRNGTHPIACAFDPVTGRLIVAKPATGQPDVEEVRVAHSFARGALYAGGPYERNADDVAFEIVDAAGAQNFVRVVDRLTAVSGAASDNFRRVRSLDDALADWGAHGAGKIGWIVLSRCDRETPAGGASDFTVPLHPDMALTIVAAQWRSIVPKPGNAADPARIGFLVRRERAAVLDGALTVQASAAPGADGRAGSLTLDGVEVTQGIALEQDSFDQLRIRHCTVRRPGGTAIATTAPLIGCGIAIERSLVGQCRFEVAGQPGQASLHLADTVVIPDDASGPVVAARSCDSQVCGSTVFGPAAFRSLDATNALFAEPFTVVRRQAGCVRFSFVPVGSVAPRRFRCAPDVQLRDAAEAKGQALTASERAATIAAANPAFVDTATDAPGLAMLHAMCSDAIGLGGEGETEIGAFARESTRLRLRNMTRLFDTYLPMGRRAAIIDDTQSRIVAEQRNRP